MKTGRLSAGPFWDVALRRPVAQPPAPLTGGATPTHGELRSRALQMALLAGYGRLTLSGMVGKTAKQSQQLVREDIVQRVDVPPHCPAGGRPSALTCRSGNSTSNKNKDRGGINIVLLYLQHKTGNKECCVKKKRNSKGLKITAGGWAGTTACEWRENPKRRRWVWSHSMYTESDDPNRRGRARTRTDSMTWHGN